MEDLIGMASGMSPMEVGYHLEGDDHGKEAHARGVAWTMMAFGEEASEDLLLWAERGRLDAIYDDGILVGFTDRCAEENDS